MDIEALLRGLSASQREAVATEAAPLCILAGPGSGKTRVLTRRIAYGVAVGWWDPRHVLAVTFTRAAARELRQRLVALGVREPVAAGTFHAMAYAQLRRCWADAGVHPPALLDPKVRLLGRLMPLDHRGSAERAPAAVAAEIEWAKARLVSPAGYEAAAGRAGRRPPLPLPAMAAVYERYEEEKRRRGVVDLDDLIVGCARAVEHDPTFAAAQRWRFRHLFVDEFQDVNPAQARLLEAWRGGRPDLCVVGDPDQAIYAWNGADPDLLRSFPERHPGTTVVRLDDNFRSTPQVVSASTAVLGPPRRPPQRPHRPAGPPPTVTAHADDLDEARAVARALRDRRPPGAPWSGLAVLARTNAQLHMVAEACAAAGVPVHLRGGRGPSGPTDLDSGLAPLRRAGPTARLAVAIADVVAVSADPSAEEVRRLGEELLALDPEVTVESFLAWVPTAGERPGVAGAGVDLATFHAAKGLEWPVVFLVGLEEGLVPYGRSPSSPAVVAEERRLLHVAVSRAEQELHCSWARRRVIAGRAQPRRPSRWLHDVRAATSPDRPAPDWRARLAGPRRHLPTGGDDAVLTALRTWRATVARASGVAPSAVMPDRALVAVAQVRPTDRDSLRSVPGLSAVRAARFGDELLSVVARAPGP